MKFIITLALFVVVAVSALPHNKIRSLMPRPSAGSSRIIGGSPAELGQFPYQAAVYSTTSTGTYFCTGSLISSNWVLTSAYCAGYTISFKIYLGTIDLQTPNVQVTSSRPGFIHPDFVKNIKSNNIALIQLDSTVQFNAYILPVTLNGAHIGAGQNGIVSGWGFTNDSSTGLSQFLNWAVLQTIDNAECDSVFSGVDDGMICAISVDFNKTICYDDWGSPLVLGEGSSAVQIGIAIFLPTTSCEAGLPSGFTRISFYRDWIKTVSGI